MSSMDRLRTALTAFVAQDGRDYKALHVSWCDAERAVGSSWGRNICDVTLKSSENQPYLVVRPSNFDDRQGHVSTADITLLVPDPPEDAGNPSGKLKNITLKEYLSNLGQYAAYTGLDPGVALECEALDEHVSIRFQAVFIPADTDAIPQMYNVCYNYQTQIDTEPAVAHILCTTQGTSFQLQRAGTSCGQYLHRRLSTEDFERVYLQTSWTSHGISLEQSEDNAVTLAAREAGQGTVRAIGTPGMGSGLNRLMTIQVPLKQPRQKPRTTASKGATYCMTGNGYDCCGSAPCEEEEEEGDSEEDVGGAGECGLLFDDSDSDWDEEGSSGGASQTRVTVRASAARVSLGDSAGPLEPLAVSKPRRSDTQRCTITVQFYYLVQGDGGVTYEDVVRAIDVCEEALASTSSAGTVHEGTAAAATACSAGLS